jgi:carbonic anhydrase
VIRFKPQQSGLHGHQPARGRLRKLKSRQGSMRKIFHFQSPAAPYVADAAVLCCFDHRIGTAVRKFLKKQGIERADMIVVAGGAKTLASPRNDFEENFILEQVRMSIRLHQTKRVLVMSHSDCATYGGLAHFKGDRHAEALHHQGELLRAGRLLISNFPGISVEPYFVDFDGIFEVRDAGHGESGTEPALR